MVDEVLHPCEVCVPFRRNTKFPANVVLVMCPITIVKRRIRQNEIRLKVFVEITPKSVGIFRTKITVDAAKGEVHSCQTPRCGIGLLSIDRDVANSASMYFHDSFALDEHSPGATAWIIYSPMKWLQDFNQELNNVLWRVELSSTLPFSLGKSAEEVFVYPAQDVFRAVFAVAKADRADQVDQLTEPLLIERRSGVLLRQHAFEPGIVALDGDHWQAGR